MKFTHYIFLFWTCLPCLLQAQTGIKGTTRNAKGEPLPLVSIYVKNLQTGTISNEDALYELRLQAGKYQITFQEMAHKTIEKEITVTDGFVTVDIQMEAQSFDLKEVSVTSSREDPAYTIMRKAIAMSKIHKLQVDSYKALIYIKGTGKMLNIPKLLEKRLEREDGMKEGKLFLNETITALEFVQPNQYTQKVLSSRSSETADGSSISPMDFLQGSFYDEKLNGILSPLAPSAFAYYKFAWEASYKEQGYEINKIKVIPRSKGDNVWEGYLYIVEDKWCIHSLQLHTTKLKFGIDVQQLYAPITQGVFMPITHQFKIGGKIFGFEGEYNYLVSSSDYELKINPTYNQQFKLIDEKIEREKAKIVQKARQEKTKEKEKSKDQNVESALLSGEELTRKNLRQLMKEAEKQAREQARQKKKKGEIPDEELVKNETTIIDSLAFKRAKNQEFWEKNRAISLTEEEKNAYKQRDSTIVADSLKAQGKSPDSTKAKKQNGGFSFWDIFMGGDYKAGKRGRFIYGGILRQLNYNTIEGFAGNLKLAYQRFGKRKDFKITGWGRYATGRQVFTGKGELAWTFLRRTRYDTLRFRESKFSIDGGRFIEQFNTETPMPMFMNSLYTLFFEQNYLKLYEKEYARIRYNSTLNEQLSLTSSLEFARRQGLENTADYRFFEWKEREFTSNAPENVENIDTRFPTHNALIFQAKLTYLPSVKYGKRNGRRYVISDKSPVLSLDYRRGMLDVNYDLLAVGLQHSFDWGIRSTVGYAFSGGAFLNKQTMYFPDYKHFNGNRIFVQFADPVSSFRLMDYYRYSSMDKFVIGHAYIKLRKFLFTQIPIFYLTGVRENIFVNQLFTPQTSYTETGYTLDGVLRLFRIEGVVAFENGKYREWGIRVGITTTFGLSVNGD